MTISRTRWATWIDMMDAALGIRSETDPNIPIE